jgi:Na+-driven multidrug efflux pump
VAWGVFAGLVLTAGVALGRHGLAWLASDDAVADIAVSAGGVVAAIEPVAAVLFVADGIFLGLLALGTMAVSTGAGAIVAIGLMLWTPFGDSVNGIWWAMALFLVVRGIVFAVGYRRAAVTAVRS